MVDEVQTEHWGFLVFSFRVLSMSDLRSNVLYLYLWNLKHQIDDICRTRTCSTYCIFIFILKMHFYSSFWCSQLDENAGRDLAGSRVEFHYYSLWQKTHHSSQRLLPIRPVQKYRPSVVQTCWDKHRQEYIPTCLSPAYVLPTNIHVTDHVTSSIVFWSPGYAFYPFCLLYFHFSLPTAKHEPVLRVLCTHFTKCIAMCVHCFTLYNSWIARLEFITHTHTYQPTGWPCQGQPRAG